MDAIDHQLLGLLEHDGRASYTDLGRQVGLSTPAVKRRVEALQDTGVISGYRAVVDYTHLGIAIEAFIELRFTGNVDVDEIWKSAQGIPEVHAVYTMAGDLDALVLTRTRDIAHLQQVINQLRRRRHVISTRTLIIMDVRDHGF